MKINIDCRHFDGYKPCEPHKKYGVHCERCAYYDRVDKRILILKLGAAGEVIRCTPILRHIEQHHPGAFVVWMTDFPELIPDGWVDQVVRPDWQTIEWLKAMRWDLVLSLDKEHLPCALARQADAITVKGFTLSEIGQIVPADSDSVHKWRTGIFDDLMKANKRHYLDELFEMCGWSYGGQSYVLPEPQPAMLNPLFGEGPVVGLNTGAGSVWPTRIWPEDHFAELIRKMKASSLQPVLLGGPDEHDRNVRLQQKTGAVYHGVKPLRRFLSVVNSCDVVVTAVTMTLHVAIGLQKRIVLFNNIFNRHEFHLFGLGEVLEPELACLACYKRSFDQKCPVKNCMELITVENTLDAIRRQVECLDENRSAHAPGY